MPASTPPAAPPGRASILGLEPGLADGALHADSPSTGLTWFRTVGAMDDAAAETLCKRAMVELVFLLRHQRQPKTRERRDWSLLRSLVRDGARRRAAGRPAAGGPVARRPAAAPPARAGRTPVRPAGDAGRHRDHDADAGGGRGPGGVPQLVRHAGIRGSLTEDVPSGPKMLRDGREGRGGRGCPRRSGGRVSGGARRDCRQIRRGGLVSLSPGAVAKW